MVLHVDSLAFDFPNDWTVSKFDEWVYYRQQFCRSWNRIKAIDIVAIDTRKTLWLIEAKDYRTQRRTKACEVAAEFANKVFDTLAALLPARLNASEAKERDVAKQAIRAMALRTVLHLEQPSRHSKLFPRAINPADVRLKLRKLLRAIDAHPVVTEKNDMHRLPWTVG